MELKQPKRKQFGNKIPQSQPLPVLVESISGITACNSLWPVYIGTFSGDSVIVSSRDEMTSLYNMGFFGKGCLSRGYPSFGEDKKGVPPIICERQWKRRKLWMDQLLSFTNNSVLGCDDTEKTIESSNDTAKQKSSKEIINSDFEDVQIIENESDESMKNNNKTNSNLRSNGSTKNDDDNNKCRDDEASSRIPSKQNSSSNKRAIPVTDTQSSSSLAIMNVTLGSSCRSSFDRGADSPLCEQDPNQSNSVIVIDDGGSDDEQQLQSPKPRLCNELIKTAVETLNLTLEEAFFLSFGLGCLQVVDLQGIFLSLQGMWHLYKDSQPDFISSYVSYHYFRSKGWIVKPGSKFGGNFLLYKQGPPFYHASYIVLIEDINNKFNNSNIKSQLTWTKIMGLNRIAETAGKEILLCQVQWPEGVIIEDLDNPNVISKFKVQEVLLRRWNSGHEREEKDQ